MMKKLMVLIVVLAALVGCQPWWNVEDDYDPTFEVVDEGEYFIGLNGQWYKDDGLAGVILTTPEECCLWTLDHVNYIDDDVHDEFEYWQSPDQTYLWRAGDCEDFTLLAMYVMRKELGDWPKMVLGIVILDGEDIGGHAWIEYQGRWYEAQSGEDVTSGYSQYGWTYKATYTAPYGEAMWRSMNTHRSITEEK